MSSTYCDQDDIEDIFGATAVAKWAAQGDGAGAVTARITRAIAYAGDRIDSVLRVTPYKIPATDSSGNVPTEIENIAATLAGVWLFQIRGYEDLAIHDGQPIHRLYFAKKDAMDYLEDIRTGDVKINAVTG